MNATASQHVPVEERVMVEVCFNTQPAPSPIRFCAGRQWPHGKAVCAIVTPSELAQLRQDTYLIVREVPPELKLDQVRTTIADRKAELDRARKLVASLEQEVEAAEHQIAILSKEVGAKPKVDAKPKPTPVTDAFREVSESMARASAADKAKRK